MARSRWLTERGTTEAWLVAFGLVASLVGCGTVTSRMILHEPDAFEPAGPSRFILPDSIAGPRGVVWALFGDDSLVLYRPGRPPFMRQPDPVVRFRRTMQVMPAGGLVIEGFTRTDGSHAPYDGTVRREGDQLVFEPRRHRGLESATDPPLRLPLSEVRSLQVWDSAKATATAVVFITIAAGTAALWAVGGLF